MTARWLLLGALAWLVLRARGEGSVTNDNDNDGKRDTRPPPRHVRARIDRRMSSLVPSFRERLQRVLDRMRSEGFEPMVWETYRSAERAQELADRGTGIARSVHRLGLAADIIDANTKWAAGPAFWQSLGRIAEDEGLTWGGRWQRPDRPHVQAIPVHRQSAAWALASRLNGDAPQLAEALDELAKGVA